MNFSDAVLAENITITRHGDFYDVEFDWLCPHCNHRHWARELNLGHPKQMFGLLMGTGTCSIKVRMPWADTTPRDLKSVYGHHARKTGNPEQFDRAYKA